MKVNANVFGEGCEGVLYCSFFFFFIFFETF